MFRFQLRALAALVLFVAPLSAALAASVGTLAGKVIYHADGSAVAGAQVRLAGTTRQAETDAAGAFRFEQVPAGTYLVVVETDRFGAASASTAVISGETTEVEIPLDLSIHGDELVVTATADARTLAELAQAVGVLSGDELAVAARGSLGETLSSQPGVNSTFFGAGASRPVVRGQGGNRIRILENGVDSGDVSDTSPDHAVALDPLSAEKIEVVRGAATLLYGSNAIGGVVNVIDDRIAEYRSANAIEGQVQLVGGSNADELTGAVAVGGSVGALAWRAGGFKRTSDDYASGEGTVANSDSESDGANLGLSFVGENGFFGAAYRAYDANYGNPAEEEVRLDQRQRRIDVRGGITTPLGIWKSLRLRFGHSDYEHTEFEGPEVGTVFLNDAWEARIDAPHKQLGLFQGAVGIQVANRAFEAIGEEAFVPPTENDTLAAFLFEEIGTGSLRAQVGLRHERQDSSAKEQPDRSFSGTSASFGGLFKANDTYTIALTGSRSVRFPDPEQLYSNGPHIATGVFEIGDPDLREETTLGIDLALHKTTGRLRGSLSLFTSRADDYVYDDFTGEVVEGEEDALPIVRFVQADAFFTGAEAELHFDLLHSDPHHLELELTGDLVRAKLRGSGEPLPRIPAARFGGGVRYQGSRFQASLFCRRTENQARISEFETPTAGHTFLDASIGYRFYLGGTVHDLILAGTNLTDEYAQEHISYLKEVAPLLGRDVRLTYRLAF